jgi:hypothetical protein
MQFRSCFRIAGPLVAVAALASTPQTLREAGMPPEFSSARRFVLIYFQNLLIPRLWLTNSTWSSQRTR